MGDYKKILVAVDFSPVAEKVIGQAVELAKRYDARLLFLHVVEYVPPIDVGYEPVTPATWMVDETLLVENAKTSLHDFVSKLQLNNAVQRVEVGIPKHTIAEIAMQENVDLIVIGSHGRHGLDRLLGSTANGVLHNAKCDVLAVRVQDG